MPCLHISTLLGVFKCAQMWRQTYCHGWGNLYCWTSPQEMCYNFFIWKVINHVAFLHAFFLCRLASLPLYGVWRRFMSIGVCTWNGNLEIFAICKIWPWMDASGWLLAHCMYNRSALREERLIHVGVLHLFAMTIGVPVRSNIEHGRQCWWQWMLDLV